MGHMTTPVTSSAAIATQNTVNSNTHSPVPIGVGSQPTMLSSPSSSNNSNYCETIKTSLGSFSDFIRTLVVNALEGIRSGIGFISGWIGGKSEEKPQATSQPSWQLPIETHILTTSSSQDPFAALPITDQEREKIYTIVHTIGTSQGMMGWMTLLRQKSTLEQLGQEIQHVHPFKFLEYSLKHETLKKDMDSLSQGPLTWRPFISGISEKMQRESATLAGCRIGLARSLNINLADIDPYLARSDWEGFVKFLIDVKNGRKSSAWIEPNVPATSSAGSTTATLPASTTSDASTSSAILMTPSPTVYLADLPFERGDEDILVDLMGRYSQNSRWRLLWNYSHLNLQWTHLGARHPLKLLAYLYSKPALMTQMGTIFEYYGTKAIFISSMTGQLSKLSFVEIRPYIDEFAQVCNLDPNGVKQQIQNGQWHQLVEALLRSHLARRVL